jgi:hypothetical protein
MGIDHRDAAAEPSKSPSGNIRQQPRGRDMDDRVVVEQLLSRQCILQIV